MAGVFDFRFFRQVAERAKGVNVNTVTLLLLQRRDERMDGRSLALEFEQTSHVIFF